MISLLDKITIEFNNFILNREELRASLKALCSVAMLKTNTFSEEAQKVLTSFKNTINSIL